MVLLWNELYFICRRTTANVDIILTLSSSEVQGHTSVQMYFHAFGPIASTLHCLCVERDRPSLQLCADGIRERYPCIFHFCKLLMLAGNLQTSSVGVCLHIWEECFSTSTREFLLLKCLTVSNAVSANLMGIPASSPIAANLRSLTLTR